MDTYFKKEQKRQILLLVLAGLLPLLLCLVFTFIEARKEIRRQQSAAVIMLLKQAETISDQAWRMADHLQQYATRPCADISHELQEYASLFPYFRSVGLMHNNSVTCSSAYGGKAGDLATMIQRPVPRHEKPSWAISLAATYGVRDRPAVLFVRNTPPAFSSYAIVDGQYLLDFMDALSESHGYSIGLKYGSGYEIVHGPLVQTNQTLPDATATQKITSARYPISIRITTPSREAMTVWRQVLFTFIPMALILSLLLMALTHSWLKRKLSAGDRLVRAIRKEEFSVHYQPVYNLVTGVCSGVEALMRWQLPDGTWIRPDVFIAAAETEGKIVPLTRHLLQLIVEDTKSWKVPPGFHLAVNLAAEHLQHPGFVDDMRGFAAQITLPQPRITLELTERSLIKDGEAVSQKLKLLQSEGMFVAIDDFGTGHCALSLLQTFPLDYLKIDRGFVNAIESCEREAPVLDAIIHLSHKLKLSVVAEGVETPEQMAYLQARDVVFIQGYLYARPMNSAALQIWLKENGRTRLR
ncbi:EAL domain-containing protein [Erwinia sp. P6884]|uniref:EAL domain-containing protein n=1 Tax=Erwinia sp. P6884 TaxID=3141450 RepID=UPI00318D6821